MGNETEKSVAQRQADTLRNEAKRQLNALLKIPEGISSGTVDWFVDCVISAAVLEMVSIRQEAAKHINAAPP